MSRQLPAIPTHHPCMRLIFSKRTLNTAMRVFRTDPLNGAQP
jgi:hypothetical protein